MTAEGGDVVVMLPSALREWVGGHEAVGVQAATLAEALEELNSRFPGFAERILDDMGRVRRYVHVFVNERSIGQAEPAEVVLRRGDLVHILPSVAGGLVV